MPISGRSLPSKRRSGWPAKPHFPANISMTRHGAAGFYRVWRSHPFFGTAAVGAGQSPSISVLAPASDCSLAPNPPDGRHAPAEISPPAPCLARHPRLELAPTERRITIRRGTRRGGRVVECTALEMRHTGNRIGGSNPSLSASYPFRPFLAPPKLPGAPSVFPAFTIIWLSHRFGTARLLSSPFA